MQRIKRKLSSSPLTASEISGSPFKSTPSASAKKPARHPIDKQLEPNLYEREAKSPASPWRSGDTKGIDEQQLSMEYTVTRGSASRQERTTERTSKVCSPGKTRKGSLMDEVAKLKAENRKLKEELKLQNPPP